MSCADLIKAFLPSLSIENGFVDGAKKLSSFLKKFEEHFEPSELISTLFAASPNPSISEYILFCFLDIHREDIDVANRTIPFHRITRLLLRSHNNPESCSEIEFDIVDKLASEIGITEYDQLKSLVDKFSEWFELLFENKDIDEDARSGLSKLIEYEARALQARTEWLSETIDVYNMKKMARLLPLLSLSDEMVKMQKDLASGILAKKKLGLPIMRLELDLKKDGFEKFLKKISKSRELSQFHSILLEQRTKLIPLRELVAVSTIARWSDSKVTSPLQWVESALSNCTHMGFTYNAGTSLTKFEAIAKNCSLQIEDTYIIGDFQTMSLAQLTGSDMLTRSLENEKEPDVKELVMRFIGNELLLNRLLDNPKVFNKPGLVELIVRSTHSLPILHKIASMPHLHSGAANARVPLALLKSPARIPLNLLRPFINVRMVGMADFREILRNPYQVRSDVFSEVKEYVEHRN